MMIELRPIDDADDSHLALTVERVTIGGDGKTWHGVASNDLCNWNKGDKVAAVGRFGETYLMADHDGADPLMICTTTGRAVHVRGSAVLRPAGQASGQLHHHASGVSRLPDPPRDDVQDRLREHAAAVAELLRGGACVYICGFRGMEDGVLQALGQACTQAGID